MSSPIRVLEHNIAFKFEHINEYSSDQFKKYVQNEKVQPCIIWDTSCEFFFPKVNTLDGQIIVNEKFLEYIWILIFSHWVLYEEDQMKREINIVQAKALIVNEPLIDRAQRLSVVCKTLSFVQNGWDYKLPNPEMINPIDKFFVEKVNGIFQDSIALFLNHELAHLVLNHKPSKLISPAESVDQEKKADNFALQAYLDGREIDIPKAQSGLAVLFTYFSPFFIAKNPASLISTTHPDTDVRLYNALEKVGFHTNEECYYFYKLAFTLIHDFLAGHKDFMDSNGLVFPSEPVETARDLFEVYVDLLENAKRIGL
jgi:hypothetical protein